MEIIASFIIVITFLGTIYPLQDISQDDLFIYPEAPGIEQLSFKYKVKPLSDFTYENLVRQEFDYSCGSAALATLLNYYLGESLTEHQVIQGLMEYGDTEKIQQRRAFSLLDMKRFVTVLGYNGAGYTAEIEDLKTIDKPAIIPIEFFGYKHFVVFRGIYGDHIFFADPYMGNTSYTLKRFSEMWSQNIVFIVSDGGITMTNLMLDERDLRIVEFDVTKEALGDEIPPSILREEKQFIESMGEIQYRTTNVK